MKYIPSIRIKLTFIAMTIVAMSAFAAKSYTVYDLSGKVYIIKKATPILLKKGMTLTESTILRINPKSEVQLLEKPSKTHLFRLKNKTGLKGLTVKKLVEDARQHEKASITDINKTIIGGLSVNKLHDGKFNRTGVARVVTNASGTCTMLRSLLGPDEVTPQGYRPIKAKKIDDGNGIFHFSLRNDSDDLFYANIICKDSPIGIPDFLLPENVILQKNAITDLNETRFAVPTSPFAAYILILSDSPFTAEDIERELDVETQDLRRDYFYEVIR